VLGPRDGRALDADRFFHTRLIAKDLKEMPAGSSRRNTADYNTGRRLDSPVGVA
jgi:hypothetical protein